MKLTDSKNYQNYMVHFAGQQYALAAQDLQLCIDEMMNYQDADQIVYLLQTMGNVMYESGKIEEAITYYKLASKDSEGSPEEIYRFAVFYTDKLASYNNAIKKCDELIGRTNALPENDQDKNFYLASGYALRGYCYSMLGDYRGASLNLHNLLGVEEVVIGYALKLCENLISVNDFRDDAIKYLLMIKAKLSDRNGEPQSARVAPMLEQIKRILDR